MQTQKTLEDPRADLLAASYKSPVPSHKLQVTGHGDVDAADDRGTRR